MSVNVFAPGSDNTTSDTPNPGYVASNGAGGQFARFIKGSTPKYAVNHGPREEQMANTMARMFVRVDQGEYTLFKNSIADGHVQNIINRLAGDPQAPSTRAAGSSNTGYMDFLLRQVNHSFSEKVQCMETLSDNYVVYYFGQSAPVWAYQGSFINSVQDDQASNFVRLYLEVLRGTQLARRQKVVTLRYDSFTVAGTIESIQWSLESSNELICPFTFTFRVKRLYVTNFTAGWIPMRPLGPIGDPNAIAFDSGSSDRSRTAVQLFSVTPPGTVPGPTPQTPDPPFIGPPDAGPAPNASFPTNPNPDVRSSRPVTSTPAAPLTSG